MNLFQSLYSFFSYFRSKNIVTSLADLMEFFYTALYKLDPQNCVLSILSSPNINLNFLSHLVIYIPSNVEKYS